MKLPGVESADVSLDKASADIRLKADNRITMQQLRQLLKKSGYPTRDAQIEARAKVIDRGGTLVLDLLNGSTIDVDRKNVTSAGGGSLVQITGVSRADAKGDERVTIQTVR